MKINELNERDTLGEAPMGFGQQLKSKIASYVPGETGAVATGKLATGKLANQLKINFAKYIGTRGISMPDVTGKTVIDFIDALRMNTKRAKLRINNDLNTVLDKPTIDDMILIAAQDRVLPKTQKKPQKKTSTPTTVDLHVIKQQLDLADPRTLRVVNNYITQKLSGTP